MKVREYCFARNREHVSYHVSHQRVLMLFTVWSDDVMTNSRMELYNIIDVTNSAFTPSPFLHTFPPPRAFLTI